MDHWQEKLHQMFKTRNKKERPKKSYKTLQAESQAVHMSGGAERVYSEEYEQFLSEYEDYLQEGIWVARNGRILEYRIPLINQKLTSQFLYDTFVDLCKTYKNIFRVSIQIGFYLEDMLTGETRLFYNSHNTSIIEPEYLYVNRRNRDQSYKKAKKILEHSESERFMTSLLQQYADSSRSVNATPVMCVFHCVLLRQKKKILE